MSSANRGFQKVRVLTHEEEASIVKMALGGRRQIDIARDFGYKSRRVIGDILKKHGVVNLRAFVLSEEQLSYAILAYGERRSLRDISRDLHVSTPNLVKAMTEAGVVLRQRVHGAEMEREIASLYEQSGLTQTTICERLGITMKVVTRIVKDLGLKRLSPVVLVPRKMWGKLIDQFVHKHGPEKGRELYEAYVENMRAKSTGENNAMYGKPSPAGSGNGWKGWYRDHYFRSFRELTFLIQAERDSVAWTPGEKVSIPYVFEGSERTYRPDFLIGTRMIELKPERLIKSPAVQAKAEAARAYCAANGLTYEIFDPGIDSDLIQHAYEAGLVRFVGDYEQRFLDYISPPAS